MQSKPNSPLKSFTIFSFHFLLLHHLLQLPAHCLTTDGLLLLSFKHSVLSDPLSVLQSWNSTDQTPCSWTGVSCSDVGDPASSDGRFRVTGLVLPSSQLLGSVSPELFNIEHLANVDLSGNLFNGTLPSSIFNSSQLLQALSLSGNKISGELPESVTGMTSLKLLNLSENAMSGTLPGDFSVLKHLTVLSLRGNYFSGDIPIGFDSVTALDLSSNRLNGSLPADFGAQNMRYLNLSYNRISGLISAEFAGELPGNATVDLSFNNLTGAIPMSPVLIDQKAESFSGNTDLCGKPLKILCVISSIHSTPPNLSVAIPPAIAVIPTDPGNAENRSGGRGSLKPGLVAAISVTNLMAIAILAMIILYVYQQKHRRRTKTELSVLENGVEKTAQEQPKFVSCPCLNMKSGEESSSETATSSSDGEATEKDRASLATLSQSDGGDGELVALDGDMKLDLETLLKAAAYVLGTSGGSIVYKAVVADGTAFAVRRIGGESCCVKRKKDFERHVRDIAKVKHRNLLRVRGFHWGDDEKLLICDYASNGSLDCSSNRSRSSSWACHFPVEVRLRIARGVARGLAHIHEKKQVHGNIKPSNILLDSVMEPIISDLGLGRLISISTNRRRRLPNSTSTSTGPFLSNQCWAATSQEPTGSPYEAPESQQNPKPNPKWDVYSFGVILLELLRGRVDNISHDGQSCGSISISWAQEEERNVGVMEMEDLTMMGSDVVGKEKEESGLALGFRCASLVPHKRPTMREVLQVIETFIKADEH